MASSADRALQLVALRQAQRRLFNERLAALDGTVSADEATRFRCECGLVACGTTIKLTADEYAEVRSEPRRFAVLAGHAMPEAERIVASRRGWVIVESLLSFARDGNAQRNNGAVTTGRDSGAGWS
jgi:hypothetical protein